MQIIFDSRFDSVADAQHMRNMLDTYISGRSGVRTPEEPALFPGKKGHESVVDGVQVMRSAGLPDPVFQQNQATVDGTTAQPLSFTPGDVSGSVPSPAGAAQLPIAHEEPADGVPMPPTVASVPAPPTAAPEAPAAPSTSAPSAEGMDSTGLPWDKRIHSSSKAKNADGSWRKLRGLNDGALVARVEAELRAVAANPGNPALHADAAMLAGMGMDPMSGQPLAAVPTPPQVPPPPGTTVAPPVPAAPDVATPEGLMEWVTPRMMDGRLTFDTVAAALQANGVESLAALKTNPAAVPGVYAALGGT